MCNNERRERYLDVGSPRAARQGLLPRGNVAEVPLLLPAVATSPYYPWHEKRAAASRSQRALGGPRLPRCIPTDGMLGWCGQSSTAESPCASQSWSSTLPGTRVDGITDCGR